MRICRRELLCTSSDSRRLWLGMRYRTVPFRCDLRFLLHCTSLSPRFLYYLGVVWIPSFPLQLSAPLIVMRLVHLLILVALIALECNCTFESGHVPFRASQEAIDFAVSGRVNNQEPVIGGIQSMAPIDHRSVLKLEWLECGLVTDRR